MFNNSTKKPQNLTFIQIKRRNTKFKMFNEFYFILNKIVCNKKESGSFLLRFNEFSIKILDIVETWRNSIVILRISVNAS